MLNKITYQKMAITNITYSGLCNNIGIGASNINNNTNSVLEVKTDIIFQGSSLASRLTRLEEAMACYHVLAEKYPRLKEINQEYQQELKKYITWETMSK